MLTFIRKLRSRPNPGFTEETKSKLSNSLIIKTQLGLQCPLGAFSFASVGTGASCC